MRIAPALALRDCLAVIKNATVLVNSSFSEGMPSSILQAMALGKFFFRAYYSLFSLKHEFYRKE